MFGVNVPTAGFVVGNTMLTPASSNTGGLGGTGGSSPGTGTASGAAGVRGGFGDSLRVFSCGGGCASGTSCDGNGVCVPN